MAKIRLETGQVINFEGNPSQSDINEAISKLNIPNKKSIFPEVTPSNVPLATLQGMGKDITAIPSHFFNQFLLNAPRSLATKFGYEYPEETTSPVAGVLAKIAGIVGGLKNPLIRRMTGGGTIPQQMLRAGVTGALYSPTEDFTDIGQRATQAGISAVFPPAIAGISKITRPLVSEGIPKVVRGLAGVSSKSVKWLKERGISKIFDPVKEQIDYVKTNLAPKLFNVYKSKTEDAVETAGQLYEKSLAKLSSPQIGLSNTFKNIQNILKGYDLIDNSGNLIEGIKEKEIPSGIKIMADMYERVIGQPSGKAMLAGLKVTPQVNKGYFSFYRQALRQAQKNAGVFKKDIQNVIEGLYDDMEVAGATGIRTAKDLYRKGIQFEDKYPLTLDQLASKLQSAADNPKNWHIIRESMRPIFGKNTDEIFNLLKDYRVSRELSTRGKYPKGLWNIASTGIKAGLGGYYEKGLPSVQAGQKIGVRGIDLIRNIIRKTQGL